MKYLTERTEIAKAMNFGKHPVLYIDMDAKKYEGSDYCQGCRVRVHWDDPNPRYKDMYSTGNLYYCDGKFAISNDATCLSADFGRSDVIGMYQQANTPMIHKGDIVVMVMDFSKQRMCKVALMKMPDWINKFCQTLAVLKEMEEDANGC